jgi:hypothetical protein
VVERGGIKCNAVCCGINREGMVFWADGGLLTGSRSARRRRGPVTQPESAFATTPLDWLRMKSTEEVKNADSEDRITSEIIGSRCRRAVVVVGWLKLARMWWF